MRQKHFLSVALVILLMCFGCSKSSDSPDLTSGLTGMYNGVWVVSGIGQVSGTCEVTKVSDTSVDLDMTAGGAPTPTVPGVKLSDGGNGKIILKFSDSSGTLDGSIQNDTIRVTLVAGSITEKFTGTK